MSCWVSEKIKAFIRVLAQLLSALAHLVGREDHHRIGAGVRGADRSFLFFCRRLTHGEQDAVFPLGQLFGGRPVAFLLGHFGEVLDGDLVVHETSLRLRHSVQKSLSLPFTTGSGQASPLASTFRIVFPLYRMFYSG